MTSTRGWSASVPVIITMMMSLAAGALSPATGAHARAADDGNIGVRLLEAPVDRSDDPRARSYIIDHLAPGTSIQRAFEVSNTTDKNRVIELYPGPAGIKGGQFVGAEAGERSELTEWTTLDKSRVELEPGGTDEVQATITVPPEASEGERYGVLWASTASTEKGQQVQTINRVGIRIYLSVGPGGEPASDFTIESLTPGRNQRGRPFVEAVVTNTGGRALDLEGILRLADGPGGLRAGPFEVRSETLAPGDKEALPVLLDKSTPAGPWKARLKLSSGLLEKRASATITFPDLGKGGAVEVEDDTPWWKSWPLWVGLGLLLLLLLAALLWWLRRRRRNSDPDETEEPAVPAEP